MTNILQTFDLTCEYYIYKKGISFRDLEFEYVNYLKKTTNYNIHFMTLDEGQMFKKMLDRVKRYKTRQHKNTKKAVKFQKRKKNRRRNRKIVTIKDYENDNDKLSDDSSDDDTIKKYGRNVHGF